MNASIEEARRAKPAARDAVRGAAKVVGVGLTRLGQSYAVKVNLADCPGPDAHLPPAIDGVPVVYEVTGRISRRPAG